MTISGVEIMIHLAAFDPPSANVPRMIKRKGTPMRAWFLLPPCDLGTPVLTTLEYVPVQEVLLPLTI